MPINVSAIVPMGDTMNCEFNTPVDYLGNTPESLATAWNWQNMTCDYVERGMVQISNGENTFYLSPKINLFELFLMGIIPMIAIILIFKVVWGFFHPQIVKFKKD